MPKYIIEREVPGVGKLNPQELDTIFQHGLGVVREMGSELEWIQSYITDDKVYCEYIAPNEQMIRDHGQKSGFPVNRITMVTSIMDHNNVKV
ncbi:MAG: hypothetical protein JWP00_774 [Chloroflexi bacterium]|jgi:hypothetical protein|nr:hypothetical protein [Chloroflexota bacterium]